MQVGSSQCVFIQQLHPAQKCAQWPKLNTEGLPQSAHGFSWAMNPDTIRPSTVTVASSSFSIM